MFEKYPVLVAKRAQTIPGLSQGIRSPVPNLIACLVSVASAKKPVRRDAIKTILAEAMKQRIIERGNILSILQRVANGTAEFTEGAGIRALEFS